MLAVKLIATEKEMILKYFWLFNILNLLIIKLPKMIGYLRISGKSRLNSSVIRPYIKTTSIVRPLNLF